MKRDQFSLRALVFAIFWSAAGLGLARLAAALAMQQPLGFFACCAAGVCFGIAASMLVESKYQAALVGVVTWFAVGAATQPAVVSHCYR